VQTDEVEQELRAAGLTLASRERLGNNTGTQLRFKTGEIVNVFDNGTVSFQGKNQNRAREMLGIGAVAAQPAEAEARLSRRVFVVYGHDRNALTQLEALLRRWQLEPLILDQLTSEGQTVIEKLEKYTEGDVAYAVVVATPDDEGHSAGRADEKKFRARQNVVLELGLLLSKLGRSRVAILLKNQDRMERPSDIQGLIYLPFADDVSEAKVHLAKEMSKQGLNIELDRL
jgi:predicted nucleotide-binding protein